MNEDGEVVSSARTKEITAMLRTAFHKFFITDSIQNGGGEWFKAQIPDSNNEAFTKAWKAIQADKGVLKVCHWFGEPFTRIWR